MKHFRLYLTLLSCLLFLAGCGQERTPADETGAPSGGEEQSDASGGEEQAALTADWQTKGFAAPGEIRENPSLWVTEYISWQHDDVSYEDAVPSMFNRVDELGARGNILYRFHSFDVADGEGTKDKYLLEEYDTSSAQTVVKEILPESLGVDGGYLLGIDILEEGSYALRIRVSDPEAAEFQPLNDYVVFTDLGESTEKADLLPAISAAGLREDRLNPEIFCDSGRNSYIRGTDGFTSRYLSVFDAEGALLAEYDADYLNTVQTPFRMPQGELVFPVEIREERSTWLLWLDAEAKTFRTLAVLEGEQVSRFYGIQGNDLYYASLNLGIVKWDIASGERTLVFSFDENSVSTIQENMLVLRQGQPPVFRMYGTVNDREEDWLTALSAQKPEDKDATRIVSLLGDTSCVKNASALASRSNPGLSFSYETCAESEKEDFRTRILADMIAGKGPDVLYVSLADMRRMQREGLLADLGEILSKELQDQVLPGILEQGTVDGVLTGLAPETSIQTVVTLKSVWDQDTWSLEDIIALLDTGKFTGVLCQGETPFAPQAVLHRMTTFGLQDGSLLDPETRQSFFDSDLFLKILKIAREYGAADPMGTTTFLGVGGSLGNCAVSSLEAFDLLSAQYGDELNRVGFPTKGSCGSYLSSDGVLVVNRNAKNSAAVAAYLECVLSDEIQYPILNWEIEDSVRKISLKDLVIWETEDGPTASWQKSQTVIPLTLREDGTTVLNEYKDFLESCVPAPAECDDILTVVWEEAQSYIEGGKSAEDVAWIIQNKIQLYLDEGGELPEN
ncbi:MAG: ABC transporter substrate-binding protein [Roseburia sp.]|nr:ABC transporter substrate-binding protein [Roseburia sp.]MCM1098415.1 ABC transporter substrate-binding protein [Ruminococcus flavefaciens]